MAHETHTRRRTNNLERPLTLVSRSRRSLTLNISETVRDPDIVGTYTRPCCDFMHMLRRLISCRIIIIIIINLTVSFRMALSDLAKDSMTRSIMQSATAELLFCCYW